MEEKYINRNVYVYLWETRKSNDLLNAYCQ